MNLKKEDPTSKVKTDPELPGLPRPHPGCCWSGLAWPGLVWSGQGPWKWVRGSSGGGDSGSCCAHDRGTSRDSPLRGELPGTPPPELLFPLCTSWFFIFHPLKMFWLIGENTTQTRKSSFKAWCRESDRGVLLLLLLLLFCFFFLELYPQQMEFPRLGA